MNKSLMPEYKIWANIIQRTTNPSNKHYIEYGQRGIRIADEWIKDSAAFIRYITTLPNYGQGLSLDRIDNSKGYIPGNLRWATKAQQSRNRSNSYFVVYRGESRNVADWCEELGIVDFRTARQRIKAGWDHIEAITTPSRKKKRECKS